MRNPSIFKPIVERVGMAMACILQDFNFLNTIGDPSPGKNGENFDILPSHNMLSARCLQKDTKVSIYKHAEIGKAESIGLGGHVQFRVAGKIYSGF